MSSRRKGAFLAPVAEPGPAQEQPPVVTLPAPAYPDTPPPARSTAAPDPLLSTAGQTPAQQSSGGNKPRVVGVAIPQRLYDELAQRVRSSPLQPSYGQVVVWACEDLPEQVRAATVAHLLAAQTAAGERPGRVGRGRPRRVEASVKVSLRLLPSELEALLAMERSILAPEGTRMTRTAVVCGALQAAFDADLIEQDV